MPDKPAIGIIGKRHRQKTIFTCIIAKYIAKAGSNHSPKAIIQQRVHRRFARRATAKVTAGDQDDLRAICFIQRKLSYVLTGRLIAQIVKEVSAISSRPGRVHKPRRYQLVGIYIIDQHHHTTSPQNSKGCHVKTGALRRYPAC